jgi:small-conductance mechanosensitive channel
VLDYCLFLGFLIVGCVIIRIAGHLFIKHLHKWTAKTKITRDDMLVRSVRKYLIPILYIAIVYASAKFLVLGDALGKAVNTVVMALITVIGAMLISSVVAYLLNRYLENKAEDSSNKLAVKWITGIIKAVIWVVALILFLDNVGVKINSLVTGLGIGGVAIAFAAQAILADIFCFFSIFFDRPFEVGDFIVAGQQMGTVEHIGVKTTRLRALNGEQLIFSNADLTGSRISNYKTLQQRRVLFTLGVTYATTVEKLSEIPGLIKGIVDSVPDTVFGRAHFASYGAYSLIFEIVYFVLSNDYNKYMDINQAINLRIKDEFDRRGIEFAFPTQTLQMQSLPPAEK